MDAPPIQYCRTEDGVNIAYWTLGEGHAVIPIESVAMSHLAMEWEVPAMRRVYERLAETFQVVRFNVRSQGLSGEGERPSTDTPPMLLRWRRRSGRSGWRSSWGISPCSTPERSRSAFRSG